MLALVFIFSLLLFAVNGVMFILLERKVSSISNRVGSTEKSIAEHSVLALRAPPESPSMASHEVFLTQLLEDIRKVGTPTIHLHDVEVIGKRLLKRS